MAVKRRKPKALRKEDSIRVRVSAEQKRVLTEAADRNGVGVSTWLLIVGLKAAKKTESGSGNDNP